MSAVAAARSILTQLHELMASRISAQGKLNQVVDIIGEALDSEVFSIYLLREGMLELFATRGLEQAAVHVTRLGERGDRRVEVAVLGPQQRKAAAQFVLCCRHQMRPSRSVVSHARFGARMFGELTNVCFDDNRTAPAGRPESR